MSSTPQHRAGLTPLGIEGAWLFTPVLHEDERGSFHEWFRGEEFTEQVGHDFVLRQANTSVSAAGVVRGVHYADVPPGQAKYVTCLSGAVLDVVVDLRLGSSTFGRWDRVLLDQDQPRAVYLAEGLGHAFMALEDRSVVSYLCSQPYNPAGEHTISPMDPDLAIAWPTEDRRGRTITPRMSQRDAAAPGLRHMLPQLPRLD